MKNFFGSAIFSIALMTSLLWPGVSPQAQSVQEPAIVVSIASIGDQLDDIMFLTEASGFGQMGNMARMQVTGFLNGVDKKRPIAGFLYFAEGAEVPDALFYVPVTNLDDVLDTIAQFADVTDEDDYSVISPPEGEPIYIKESGTYALVGQDPEMFNMAIDDIDAHLGEMPSEYNVSAKVFAQRIPAEMREQFLDQIESNYLDQIENMSEADELAAEIQMKNFEMQMEQMRSYINETDQLVLGLDFDEPNKNIHFDIEMTGLEGSKLARSSKNYVADSPSRFLGFLRDGAAANANVNMRVSEENLEELLKLLDETKSTLSQQVSENSEELPAETVEKMQGLTDEFFDLIRGTVEKGSCDMGANVMMSEDGTNIAAGLACADPSELENKIRAFVKDTPEIQNEVNIQLDVETVDGVRYHRIDFPTPPDEEELQNLFGENITVLIGFGSDVVYLAAGTDPKTNLKDSIDAKVEDPKISAQLNVFLSPLLLKMSDIGDDSTLSALADALKEGRDRVRVSWEAIDNGFLMQLELQDGILAMIQVAGQVFGGGMPGADF